MERSWTYFQLPNRGIHARNILLQRCLNQLKIESKNKLTISENSISSLNSDLISDLSSSSLNFHGGIQLLEEMLLCNQNDSLSTKKNVFNELPLWRNLVTLYSQIGESDVLLGLAVKLSKDYPNETTKALDAENCGNFSLALKTYSDLIEKASIRDVNKDELEMWEDRSLLCLNNLSDWGKLNEDVSSIMLRRSATTDGMEVNSFTDAIAEGRIDSRLKERFLPLYLNSLFHLNSGVGNEFGSFMETFLRFEKTGNENSKFQYLSNYPAEVSSFLISKQRWQEAKSCLDQGLDNFLRNWSTIHPCSYEARVKHLQKLHRITEIQDVAEFYSSKDTDYDLLLKKWCISEVNILFIYINSFLLLNNIITACDD